MHDYEALHYDKEQLKEACEWLQGWGREGRAAAELPGTCIQPKGLSDLQLCLWAL